jgi:hypothetical protein
MATIREDRTPPSQPPPPADGRGRSRPKRSGPSPARPRVGEAGRGASILGDARYANRDRIRQALVPPKPNDVDAAVRMRTSRAVFGT